MTTQALQTTIDNAWEQRTSLSPAAAPAEVRDAVNHIIDQLDAGKLRVAEKIDGDWVTHQWIKKAVLLSFRIEDNSFIKGGFSNYFDKVPSKFADYSSRDFRDGGFRVVPPAAVRKGSFIASNVVLMPS
ncbi:MAG: 2,3,4,5-tetrahydropyridine-2,6-dicarboxylate N-succinyltransferase, partial [Aquabacterium sp.]|nr:2,3,4,5-tetrahydropyridine-2,6-dicarboxylate N-succinyltransferase [Aquabacterium sp.]